MSKIKRVKKKEKSESGLRFWLREQRERKEEAETKDPPFVTK